MDVSRSTISNIEVGRHYIPIHLLYRLAEILDTSVSDFLPNNLEIINKSTITDFKNIIGSDSDEDDDYMKNVYNKL